MHKKKILSHDTTSTSLEKPNEKWAFKRNTERCNQSDSSTWTVFTENTTFHGVKYIFDKTFFILRRFVWLLLVTGAITAFCLQVALRIDAYYYYKTYVAVQINYENSLEFPAVTICNQNSYRLTSVINWGLYDFLENIYSTNKTKTDPGYEYEYDVHDINTTEFIFSTAHQREDLVQKCTWNGEDCDFSNGLSRTFTDLGVCYTFNGKQPALSNESPGPEKGLSLLLNVEQYEYMKVPEFNAGVKIQLHDPDEILQMKNQGFAVAPGTHTLVDVKKSQITFLPEPYGDCKPGGLPASTCEIICNSEKANKTCGCIDVHMRLSSHVTANICSIHEKFLCLPEVGEAKEDSSCTCPSPCKRVQYEPKISFSLLSETTIERLVLLDDSVKRKLSKKLFNAKETSRKVFMEIAKKDEKQISKLQISMNQMLHTFNYLSTKITDPKYVAAQQLTSNILAPNYFERHQQFIDLSAKHTVKLATDISIDPQFYYIASNLSEVDAAMGFPTDGDTSSAMEFLFTCNKTENKNIGNIEDEAFFPVGGLDSADSLSISDTDDNQYSWNQKVEEPSQCQQRFEEFKAFMSEHSVPESFENKLTGIIYPQYQNNINELSAHAQSDFSSNFLLNTCSSNKEQMIALDNLYFDMLQLGKDISMSSFYHEAYIYAKEMLYLYKEKEQYAGEEFYLYNEFMAPCRQLGNGASVYEREITKINDEFENIVDQRNIALAQFMSVRNQLKQIELVLLELNTTMKECDRYLDPMENMTKHELFHVFDEPTFKSNFEDLKYFVKYLKVAIKTYVHHMNRLREEITNIFENIFALELPTLHGYNVHNLKIVLDTFKISERNATLVAEGLSVNIKNSMTKLWNLTIDRLINPIKNIGIFKDIDEMSINLEGFVKDLTEHDQSLEVSSDFRKDNFIQVDIFYPELSYEEIKQNIVFEFLSLLSEIGGFLVLLLGASVLSVCEILDFVLTFLFTKFQVRKRIAAMISRSQKEN